MQIDLRACETLVINLPKDVERREHMTALCERLGLDYRFVQGIRCNPGRIGCGLSHIRALATATPGRPLLILEDDVAVEDDFDPLVSMPDDADALYVGTSNYGSVDVGHLAAFTNMVAAEPAAGGVQRVFNMVGAHAVLYLTARYKAAATAAMVDVMARFDLPPDQGLAAIQPHFNIYALARPAFYQSAQLQPGDYGANQERATRQPFHRSPVGETVSMILGGVPHPATLVRDGNALVWRIAQEPAPTAPPPAPLPR